MAFPWLVEENFSDGAFTSETDTGSQFFVKSYRQLRNYKGLGQRYKLTPYRGAYCGMLDLSIATGGSVADAYTTEAGFNVGDNGSWGVSMKLFVSSNITMANTDEFAFFQAKAGATVEAVAVINYTTANGLRLGVGETAGQTFMNDCPTDEWLDLDIYGEVDETGNSDGAITMVCHNTGESATKDSLTQGHFTDALVGIVGKDAGTTAGIILFDEIKMDDARIQQVARPLPMETRFRKNRILTASDHLFVGPGSLWLSLIPGNGTDCVATVYDTDAVEAYEDNIVALTRSGTAYVPAHIPQKIEVERGAYIVLAGTNPRACCEIIEAPYHSTEGYMNLAAKRG